MFDSVQPGPTIATQGLTDDQAWRATRKGADAARGFDFQHAASAWIAAQMLDGQLDLDRLVPEGFEDLSGTGRSGAVVLDYQIKSRQERVAQFRPPAVAKFVLALSDAQQARDSSGGGARAVLLLERDVAGGDLSPSRTSLLSLPDSHPVVLALGAIVESDPSRAASVDRAMRCVDLQVLSMHAARTQTVDILATRYSTPPAAAEKLVLVLRDHIAQHINANTTRRHEDHASFGRTSLEHLMQQTLSTIDPSAMQRALETGVCIPLDLDTALHDAQYFAGTEAQPGHVAAGLPVARPTLTDTICAALDSSSACLLVGPSGVGKSTAMWEAAAAMPHITWFRVIRAESDDVESVARLASALRPSEWAPVGFIVDGVGLARAPAWDYLVDRLAGMANVMLLGSARTEDLSALRTLPATSRIDVRLDESVARTIFRGLRAQNRTSSLHWREPYEQADGLTLEFTHLLTQGKRLHAVLTEQVQRRVVEQRDLELRLLAVVGLAHSAGVGLPVRGLQEHLDADSGQMRAAVSSLLDEHLLRSSDTHLYGLHRLRSQALTQAVHRVPPPTESETVRTVLRITDAPHLGQVITGVLEERPHLDFAVLSALHDLLDADPANPALLTRILSALRIVDFQRLVATWSDLPEVRSLNPADRAVTVMMALAEDAHDDTDDGTDGSALFRADVLAALRAITPTLNGPSPLRDELLSRVPDAVPAALLSCPDLPLTFALLNALEGAGGHVAVPGATASPLAAAMSEAPLEALADLLEAGSKVSTRLARALQEVAGGDAGIVSRLHETNPDVLHAQRLKTPDGDVAFARLLFLGPHITPEPSANTKRVARLLLRCMPGTAAADVETQLPREKPLAVGEFNDNVSRLKRRYALTLLNVEWNRARGVMAMHGLGTLSATERTARVVDLLGDLARYASLLVDSWVTHRRREEQIKSLKAMFHDLTTAAASLTLPVERVRVGHAALTPRTEELLKNHPLDPPTDDFEMADPVVTLVNSLCQVAPLQLAERNYRPLAEHLRTVTSRAIEDIRERERWELLEASVFYIFH